MLINLRRFIQPILDSPNADTRRPVIDSNFESNIAGLYVIGDLAYLEEDGQPLPMLAPVAMQQGEHAAKNIIRHLNGLEPLPFRYFDKGTMAAIGRGAAIGRRWQPYA